MPETPMQKALRSLIYGVYVVSAAQDDDSLMLLSPWVAQVNFDPPTLGVSLPADSALANFIVSGVPFVVSILRAGQKTLAEQFLHGDQGIGEGRSLAQAENGAPYLADALAILECEHAGSVENLGDHTILLGKVTAARMLSDGHPLTLRQTGFDPLNF